MQVLGKNKRLSFRRRLALGVGVVIGDKVVIGDAISSSAFRSGLRHVSYLVAGHMPQ